MAKILLFVIFIILVQTVLIQTIPVTVDERDDVTPLLGHLYHETDKIRHLLHPKPNIITFVYDVPDRFKRRIYRRKYNGKAVYVNMTPDSEDDLQTKHVNLYIDSKPNTNGISTNSDGVETKFVYMKIS